MQSSVAMPQSCTHGPKQLFLSSKRGSGGGGGDHNYKAVFRGNATELYSSAKAIFIPVNIEEEKTEEDKKEEEKGRRKRRRKRRRRKS